MNPDEIQIFIKGIEGKTTTIEIHKVYSTESENNREHRPSELLASFQFALPTQRAMQ